MESCLVHSVLECRTITKTITKRLTKRLYSCIITLLNCTFNLGGDGESERIIALDASCAIFRHNCNLGLQAFRA